MQITKFLSLVTGLLVAGTSPLPAGTPTPVGGAGSRPVAVVFCQYAGNTNTYNFIPTDIVSTLWLPNNVTFAVGGATADNSFSGLVQEASQGTVDFERSQGFGWYSVPKPLTGYRTASDVGNDCLAAAQANRVNLAAFTYAAVYMNDRLPDAMGMAWTSTALSTPSPTRLNALIVDRRGLTSSTLILHELGHILTNGGSHTNSGSDPLGNVSVYGGDPANPDPWGLRKPSVSPGWDASNRELMGFIPADALVVHQPGIQTYSLSRLTQPLPGLPTAIDVPLPNGAKYVISARTRIGRDAYTKFWADDLPYYVLEMEGVEIELFTSTTVDTKVQMSKPGGRLRSTDAVWLTGQTFTDAANGITIKVENFNPTGNPTATVTVQKPYPLPPGSWQLIGGLLVQISAGADGTVMGVSSNNQIWQWNGTSFDLVTSGLASLITVVDRTKAFVWNGVSLYVGNRNGWTPLANVPSTITGVTWLSAARDGTLYVVDTNGNVNRLDATANTWSIVGSNARRVAAQNSSTFYLVQRGNNPSGGTIHRVSGGTATELGGLVTDISVDADGNLWGVSGGAGPFHWNGNGWDFVNGPAAPDPSLVPPGRLRQAGVLSQISVGSFGNLWGLNVDEAAGLGTIFQWR